MTKSFAVLALLCLAWPAYAGDTIILRIGPPEPAADQGHPCDDVPNTTADRERSGWGKWHWAETDADSAVLYRIHYSSVLNTAHNHIDCAAQYAEIEVRNSGQRNIAGKVTFLISGDKAEGDGYAYYTKKVVDYSVGHATSAGVSASTYTIFLNPMINVVDVGDNTSIMVSIHVFDWKNYVDDQGNFWSTSPNRPNMLRRRK